MKKILCISAILMLSLLPLMSDGQESQYLLDTLESEDERMAYQFTILSTLLIEGEARGGIAAISPLESTPVASWRTDDAPESMFTSPSSEVMMAAFIMPSEIAAGIFSIVGEGEAVSAVEAAQNANPELLMIAFAEPYADAQLKGDLAEASLENALLSHAESYMLSEEDLWGAYERAGMPKEDILSSIESGERTVEGTIEDALRLIRDERQEKTQSNALLIILAIGAVALLIAGGLLLFRMSRRGKGKED